MYENTDIIETLQYLIYYVILEIPIFTGLLYNLYLFSTDNNSHQITETVKFLNRGRKTLITIYYPLLYIYLCIFSQNNVKNTQLLLIGLICMEILNITMLMLSGMNLTIRRSVSLLMMSLLIMLYVRDPNIISVYFVSVYLLFNVYSIMFGRISRISRDLISFLLYVALYVFSTINMPDILSETHCVHLAIIILQGIGVIF